ncbi:hypothetical protein [Pseudonocardia nigra]|uniref:hypothetical protein n=1 Tax=Pseudonocardia nigra TaxID=1921578 RepID=UPI001C5F94AA|nr:hypothetical protein [Pseudonocardia nigra]
MLRHAASVSGIAALLPFLGMTTVHADPGHCTVVDGAGRCLVEAADPARPGGPRDREGQRRDGPSDRPETRAGSGEQVEPTDIPEFVGVPVLGPGGRVGAGVEQVRDIALPPEAADNVTPVDPAVLAQRAVELLTLQPPSLRISATDVAFVGVPIWMWVEPGAETTGPISATATAGTSEVTATARLAGVEWAMGPPGAVVRCDGPGTPWSGQAGPSPDCGYVYEQRSLPERTGGTGSWLITATGIWQVTWEGTSGGAPVDGEQTVRLASERALPVGEIQVLVSNGGDR